MNTQKPAQFPSLKSGAGIVVLFAAMMGIAFAKETGMIDNDLAKRGVGAVMGLMLVLVGNLLPKFRLFDAPGRDPAAAMAAERFAGWTFVVVGVVYALVWSLAPMPSALVASSLIGLSGFALVALNWVRVAIRDRAVAAAPGTTVETFTRRFGLAVILITLLWGVAIFLVDYVWGDRVSQWAAIVFAVVLVPITGVYYMRIGRGKKPASGPVSPDS